ncbi:hypothetical protein AAC387_Pa01g2517 [Persea americana]
MEDRFCVRWRDQGAMESEMREMEVCEIWERWTPVAWDEEDLGKRMTMVMEERSSALRDGYEMGDDDGMKTIVRSAHG